MAKEQNEVNRYFYDHSSDAFDEIPFESILSDLFLKYGTGQKVLEIGSGPGALALWLKNKGCDITCLEPAKKLAEKAIQRGLNVHPITFKNFLQKTNMIQ
ncbi:MAG: class I SAM-dependent methyltransferase [Chlamydiales bacterium]